MGQREDDKVIEEILEKIKKLENKINETNKKIDLISKHFSSIRQQRGTVIDIEARKQEIYSLLCESNKPMSAEDISNVTNFSRSHISAILNDLFRDGKVKKIREGKVVKYTVV